MSTSSLVVMCFFRCSFSFLFFRKLMGFGVENPNVLDISFLFSTNQRSTFRHLILKTIRDDWKRSIGAQYVPNRTTKPIWQRGTAPKNDRKWNGNDVMWCDVFVKPWQNAEQFPCDSKNIINIWWCLHSAYCTILCVWLRLPRCQSQRAWGGCQIWTLEMYNYAHVAQPTREHYDL